MTHTVATSSCVRHTQNSNGSVNFEMLSFITYALLLPTAMVCTSVSPCFSTTIYPCAPNQSRILRNHFENCTSLACINLNQQNLEDLDFLALLPASVRRVDAGNNRVVGIPRVAPGVMVETLILLNNQIRSLDSLNTFLQLNYVDLSGNQIKSLPDLNLQHLTKLFLRGNMLQTINYRNLQHVPSLSELRLEDNPVQKVEVCGPSQVTVYFGHVDNFDAGNVSCNTCTCHFGAGPVDCSRRDSCQVNFKLMFYLLLAFIVLLGLGVIATTVCFVIWRWQDMKKQQQRSDSQTTVDENVEENIYDILSECSMDSRQRNNSNVAQQIVIHESSLTNAMELTDYLERRNIPYSYVYDHFAKMPK